MKIAYIDYWTKGIHNFTPIDKELKNLGHNTVLLHFGSFNSIQSSEEMVEGILCRDIFYYHTRLIFKMLEQERPDVVITLNTTTILDRVITLSCRYLKIRTIYLMHGNRNFDSSNDSYIMTFEKAYNSYYKKIGKARKYFFTIIPNYVYALYKNKPENLWNLRFLRVIYSYYKNPGLRSVFYPEYTDELIQDKCLVYSKSERLFYEQMGYDFNNIDVVGNPKFDHLMRMLSENGFSLESLPITIKKLVQSGEKYALLLEEGMPEQNNIGGVTREVRNKMIMALAERLKKENLKLVVKLHPVSKEETITARHENLIIEKDYLDPLIYFSRFCITNMSTTVNNCVLMKKPVLMPRWGVTKNLPPFFADVGVSTPWVHIDDNIDLKIDSNARNKYIDQYISIEKPVAVNNIVRAIVRNQDS